MRMHLRTLLTVLFTLIVSASLLAQTGSGTINGTVTDSTGAIVPGAGIVLTNTVSGYTQTRKTDASGQYQFTNIPQHPYDVIITAPGFSTQTLRIQVRSSVPQTLATALAIASAGEEVTVEAGGDLVENSSTFHTDLDREMFSKLPSSPSPAPSPRSSPSPRPESRPTRTASFTASATTPRTPSTSTASPSPTSKARSSRTSSPSPPSSPSRSSPGPHPPSTAKRPRWSPTSPPAPARASPTPAVRSSPPTAASVRPLSPRTSP